MMLKRTYKHTFCPQEDAMLLTDFNVGITSLGCFF